jgi:hypothetical protein
MEYLLRQQHGPPKELLTMRTITSTALLLLALLLVSACSGDDNGEKGMIEAKTEEIGQEAVRVLKTPVDKAQAVADKEAERARELDNLQDGQ